MQNVIVTGGAGYIGSHVCKACYAAGYNPITIDNLSTGHSDFVQWGPLHNIDLRETKALKNILSEYEPEAIIHLAANAYVGESFEIPGQYYWNNIGSSLSLFESAIELGINKVVFSSSCATYGISDQKVIDENTYQDPINPYGKSKLYVEKMLKDLSANTDLEHVSLRYFNVAGASFDGDIGERHEPETHLIPLAILSNIDKSTLTILGSDYETKDGTAVRDYIHVEDLAAGHLKALQYLIGGNTSDSFNLGSGIGHSILEIINQLDDLNWPVKYEIGDRRIGDPSWLVADIKKAKRILNWEPEFSQLETILSSAIDWHSRCRS